LKLKELSDEEKVGKIISIVYILKGTSFDDCSSIMAAALISQMNGACKSINDEAAAEVFFKEVEWKAKEGFKELYGKKEIKIEA
jgi:hypothetical protein